MFSSRVLYLLGTVPKIDSLLYMYEWIGSVITVARFSVGVFCSLTARLLLFATTRSVFKSVKISVVEITKRKN